MHLNFLNNTSSVFAEASPHKVSDYVNLHVGSHSLSLDQIGNATASVCHRKAGGLDLCRLRYGAHARIISEGLPDIYHVQFILNGHCRYEIRGESLSLSAGHVLMLNPEEPIDLTYSADCEKFIVRVPSSLINETCIEHRWFKPYEYIRFNQIPYRFEEMASLLSLLELVCQEAESSLATPQMLQHYSRVVASKLMTTLKHNVPLAPPSLQSISFENLVKYIEENIKRDISVEELSRYSNLSPRSIYLLFQNNAKSTPMNFIRKMKLEKVHETLMNPGNRVVNVTGVAMDYGFTHLGRFSQCYKSTFGMLPSVSLKKVEVAPRISSR